MKQVRAVDRMGYKGYYILLNPFSGMWYISKDNFHIAAAETLEDAKQAVDELSFTGNGGS